MVKLILSEKIDKRVDVEAVGEWLNRLLKKADLEVSVGGHDDKWLSVETINPELFLSTITLQVYYPLEPMDKPVLRTCWIEKIDGKKVRCSYPLIDGSTRSLICSLDDWAAYLGFGRRIDAGHLSFIKNVGIDVGYPINLTLERPSILLRKLIEGLIVRGLDVVFLRGLTPMECENLIYEGGMGKLVADFTHLTLTTHILYLKLGVKTRKVVEHILKTSSSLGKPIAYRVCEWERLKSFTSLPENCT